MKHSVRNSRGFTLTEATIAMVVLSVATAGVILPFSTGAAMNMEGSRRVLAAKLAAEYLEETASYDYDNVVAFRPPDQHAGMLMDAELNLIADEAYSRFSRFWTCSEVSGMTGLWVTVIIKYDGAELLRMSRLIGPD